MCPNLDSHIRADLIGVETEHIQRQMNPNQTQTAFPRSRSGHVQQVLSKGAGSRPLPRPRLLKPVIGPRLILHLMELSHLFRTSKPPGDGNNLPPRLHRTLLHDVYMCGAHLLFRQAVIGTNPPELQSRGTLSLSRPVLRPILSPAVRGSHLPKSARSSARHSGGRKGTTGSTRRAPSCPMIARISPSTWSSWLCSTAPVSIGRGWAVAPDSDRQTHGMEVPRRSRGQVERGSGHGVCTPPGRTVISLSRTRASNKARP